MTMPACTLPTTGTNVDGLVLMADVVLGVGRGGLAQRHRRSDQ
jgi:hypothetical protein